MAKALLGGMARGHYQERSFGTPARIERAARQAGVMAIRPPVELPKPDEPQANTPQIIDLSKLPPALGANEREKIELPEAELESLAELATKEAVLLETS
jgi:hypothetical protein